MSDPARPPTSPATPALHAALLDFFRAPGKHQLQLREPAVLFASLREVLQVAAGRTAAGVPQAEAETARQAATFFVGAALLYPGADHYAVFGLQPRAEPIELKERYRLLMRLIHPDFAGAAPTTWPADAAVRVNKAYEVLSSPTQRREYDETLARPPVARAVPRRPPPPRTPPAPRDDVDRAKLRRGLAWTLATGFALLAGSFFLGRPEPVQLVQRPEQPASAPAVVTRPVLIEEIGAAIAEATNLLRSATLTAPQEPAPQPAPPRPAPARAAAAPVALQVPARRAPEPLPAQAAVRDEAPAQLVLAPPLIPAPPPAARAEPLPLATPAREAPAAAPPIAAPPPPAPVQVAVVPRSAPPAVTAPSLTDVQPLLNQLLERLESGSGEQMLRLLGPDARNAAGAQSVQRQYDQIVRGARSVRLAQVEFISEPRGGVLFVTSRVRLHPGEPTIGSFGERFAVRAEFASRDGRVVMTSLSGASD